MVWAAELLVSSSHRLIGQVYQSVHLWVVENEGDWAIQSGSSSSVQKFRKLIRKSVEIRAFWFGTTLTRLKSFESANWPPRIEKVPASDDAHCTNLHGPGHEDNIFEDF